MSVTVLSPYPLTNAVSYPLREELPKLPPSSSSSASSSSKPRRAPRQPADQSASRLLSLPPELRNIIWSYLLVQPQTPRANTTQRNPFIAGARDAERFCANVLFTCRQIYREGLPILYGENTFCAHSQLLTALPSFLLVTKPSRVQLSPVKHTHLASLIRRYYLFVRLDTDPRFTAAQVEAAFAGVDELEVDVFQAMYGSCDFGVLRLFEGVRGVAKAVVHGSVGDGRYAAWLARTMMLSPGAEPPSELFDEAARAAGWPLRDSWREGHR